MDPLRVRRLGVPVFLFLSISEHKLEVSSRGYTTFPKLSSATALGHRLHRVWCYPRDRSTRCRLGSGKTLWRNVPPIDAAPRYAPRLSVPIVYYVHVAPHPSQE